jgi:hypothetical protein
MVQSSARKQLPIRAIAGQPELWRRAMELPVESCEMRELTDAELDTIEGGQAALWVLGGVAIGVTAGVIGYAIYKLA